MELHSYLDPLPLLDSPLPLTHCLQKGERDDRHDPLAAGTWEEKRAGWDFVRVCVIFYTHDRRGNPEGSRWRMLPPRRHRDPESGAYGTPPEGPTGGRNVIQGMSAGESICWVDVGGNVAD